MLTRRAVGANSADETRHMPGPSPKELRRAMRLVLRAFSTTSVGVLVMGSWAAMAVLAAWWTTLVDVLQALLIVVPVGVVVLVWFYAAEERRRGSQLWRHDRAGVGSAVALARHRDRDDSWNLYLGAAVPKDKGLGRSLLQAICSNADEHRLRLSLRARTRALRDLYSEPEFGFESIEPGSKHMIRHPGRGRSHDD